MKYKLEMTKKAKDDFFILERKIQIRIAEKLRFYISLDNPLINAKKLVNTSVGMYRFRVGDYRIIFDIDNKGNIIVLLILRIKHRKDVYL
ncbi:MAG: type II toxin-antitoxin system RelE/ParE family toxin [bacterium]|nr:type II toxin-antitoxin system RelE/ParE family toxin [bacterium]